MEADTLVQRLHELRDDGYTSSFSISPGGVRCDACQHVHDPGAVTVERLHRFEGESDPDDMAILLALRCASCGRAGVLVAAYGPTASAEEADVVSRLTDGRRS